MGKFTTVETEQRVSSNGVKLALWPSVSPPLSTTVCQDDELTPLVPILTLFFLGVSERHTLYTVKVHGLVLARVVLGTQLVL